MIAALVLLAEPAWAAFRGEAFEGGAKGRFGARYDGRSVNYVYAAPNGELSRMSLRFGLSRVPAEPGYLWLRARDDDGPGACVIEIRLNGQPVFRGKNPFPEDRWAARRFAVPAGTLRASNELTVRNLEPVGDAGMPPWFMVADAAIGDESFTMRASLTQDFAFRLPVRKRPIPEPLPPGQRPGFAVRGIKGWKWRPEDYFKVVPILAAHRMNFLMNCYTNLCDIEHYAWGDPRGNRWWEPIPEEKKAWLKRLVEACGKNRIDFCFSMNPNLTSRRPLRYGSPEDLEALWQHYRWMQGLGVRWFNISLDDISHGIDAEGQVRLVNEVFRRLRAADPKANLIFCPTWYWGDGSDPAKRPYLETLGRELAPDVYLFWTGDDVLGPVTKKAAERYRSVVRHRLFLWDNYPVNDDNPTMHLGPVVHRDRELGEVVDGYMSNSMCRQTDANAIPMLTCADYAYNPRSYDPERSIGQAILNSAGRGSERRVLRDLVQAYPGLLLYYEGRYNTALNPVREEFTRISSGKHSRFAAEAFADRVERLARDLRTVFPKSYLAERATVEADLKWIRSRLAERFEE